MLSIDQVLDRGVAKILPDKSGLKKLMQGRTIRLYQGFDPTGTRLHLGHSIGLKKLMQFADLGHEVIFLFGTGTVLVGDPSQRDTARKLVTQDEIDRNISDWKNQVKSIVDFDKVTIKQNGDWLLNLKLKDIVHIASQISAIQLFKRESFQRRLDLGDTVWYHETMYPLLQGYDSVAMDVDLEIGGTDQEFNMLIGRELQKKLHHKDKYVLTLPMIMGTDGKPMSKTSCNCVWLSDTPEDMYGKLMSIPDDHINTYADLLTQLTDLPHDPLTAKKAVALDIVTQYHGQSAAAKAQAHFETTVQKKQAPSDMPTISSSVAPTETVFAQVKEALNKYKGREFQSNGQIKRTIEHGGITLDGEKITDPNQSLNLDPQKTHVLKYGKRLFIKINF